jgi:hypothetical protein
MGDNMNMGLGQGFGQGFGQGMMGNNMMGSPAMMGQPNNMSMNSSGMSSSSGMNNNMNSGMNNNMNFGPGPMGGGSLGSSSSSSSSSSVPDDEAVVYQIAYGKPGPIGLTLAPHALSYEVSAGVYQLVYVGMVRQGPPGSPILPGDVAISVNSKPLVADASQSAGAHPHTLAVDALLANEPPPRVMRFFRCSKVDVQQVLSSSYITPTPLTAIDAQILLQG